MESETTQQISRLEPTDHRAVLSAPVDRWQTFSLSSLFLWVTLTAAVMGVWRFVPALGVLLAILSLGAAVRTVDRIRISQRASGRRWSVFRKIGEFLISLAAAAVCVFLTIYTIALMVAFTLMVVGAIVAVTGINPWLVASIVVPPSFLLGAYMLWENFRYLLLRRAK